MGLLTRGKGSQRTTIRDRAIRSRTRGPDDGSGLRIAVAVGLLVGLIPAIAILLASASSAPPPPTEEPVRVAAARTVVATPARRVTPRPTPTPWPSDLWTRMVTVATPEGEWDQADSELPVDEDVLEELATPTALVTGIPRATPSPTPEPEIVSPEEIERIQEAEKATVAAEAARVTPVTAAVTTNRLGSSVPAQVRRWETLILSASDRYKIDPNLIAALMMTESGGYEKALSSAGAIGLMQVMGGPWDPAENVRLGTAILASNLRRYNGRVDLALAGYNAGNGAVAKYGGIPPYRETRAHVFRVLLRYELYRTG